MNFGKLLKGTWDLTRLRSLLLQISLVPLFFVLYGCQIEDIVIKVVQKEGVIEFFFHDIDDPSEVIEVHTIKVTGITAGRCMWELNTFNPRKLYEEKNGKLVIKNIDEMPQITSMPLSHVKLGTIPVGFQQSHPPDQNSPKLIKGNSYIVSAFRGAHRGHTEFRVD